MKSNNQPVGFWLWSILMVLVTMILTLVAIVGTGSIANGLIIASAVICIVWVGLLLHAVSN